jgi:predicted DCC family thiol-disulfide oxidoreductase YuxK
MTNKDIILFFDGVCGLCNGLVDWLMMRDKSHKIKYATLQGEHAKKLLNPSLREDLDTVVVWHQDQVYTQSEAIILCFSQLSFPWNLVRIFKIIPSFLRNFIYQIIAKNRYRIFGKNETCRIPLPEERIYFLD